MKKKSSASEPHPETPYREEKQRKLKLTTQYATQSPEVPHRSAFRKWVKAALTHDAEIGLRIVDETEGRSLNRDFRNRDYATNVLTFVYSDIRPDTQALSGDIVLCAPVVEREAREQQKDLTTHYAHLTVHGVLHLQGYEHESDADAAAMERMEAEIVKRLGYEDPYKVTETAAEL